MKISLQLTDATVQEVLLEIERRSEFYFSYNSSKIDVTRKVSVTTKEKNITDILDELFSGKNVSYEIDDKHIILYRDAASEALPQSLQQQQAGKKITGIVEDQSGEPIIGANIILKGTSRGVITDIDGKFDFDVPSGATILISYIGYIPVEINVANNTDFRIQLKEDTQALDEVIVIGYGTTKRKDFTGSVTSVRMENSPVALTSNMNALESLKGNVSGLDIGYTNTAGGSPSIQVRGQNSISGNNSPLLVVDGIIFMGNIGDINPNDIATFDILKDATSAAAYGSRSANGVVIITTKKGKQGKPVINLNASGGMQTWHLQPKLRNGQDWLELVRERNRYEDYSFLTPQQAQNYENGKETNWLDESTRTGWIQDYQLSVSGAGEKMNYYLSSSFSKNDGIVVGDQFKRSTILGKVNTEITDWLKVGIDAAYTHSDYSGVAADFLSMTTLTPYDMKYHNEAKGLLEKYPNGQNDLVNPLWNTDSNRQQDLDIRNNFRMNAYAEIKIPWIKGLSYHFNYSTLLETTKTGRFYHENYYVPIGPYDDENRYSTATQNNYLASANGYSNNDKTTSWIYDNILRYYNEFGDHTIDLTAVATRDSRYYRHEGMTGSDFSGNGNTILGLDGLHYSKVQKISLSSEKRRNVGYFARASYSFKNTYYLTGSYRKDGASVFGENNKWGHFGAIGGAWRISSEKFMKDMEFLDDLKLKLSWGKNGNQGVNPYGTLSTVGAGASGGKYYTFGNSGMTYYGITPTRIGNSNLGWETTESWNTGFESAWLNNRLFVDLDIYFSRTYDQIFTRSIPVMTGFSTMQSSMGEIKNKGVELTIRSNNIQSKDWGWSSGLTFWLNRNKLERLYGEDLDGDGKEDDDIGNSLFIGHSINSIYGYKQIGIVQESDTEYMQANGVEAGTPKYADLNGDGSITVDDRSILGSKEPNFKLNLSNTVTFKNWELYVMLTGVFGGGGYYQESNKPAFIAGGRSDYHTANNMYIPYWTPENNSSKYPAAWYLGDNYFLGLQSRTYVRLQDITLSYTFREQWVKNAGIQNLKLFFTGKNLFTLTGWDGGDPEIGSTIISGTYPGMTTLSIGANISF